MNKDLLNIVSLYLNLNEFCTLKETYKLNIQFYHKHHQFWASHLSFSFKNEDDPWYSHTCDSCNIDVMEQKKWYSKQDFDICAQCFNTIFFDKFKLESIKICKPCLACCQIVTTETAWYTYRDIQMCVDCYKNKRGFGIYYDFEDKTRQYMYVDRSEPLYLDVTKTAAKYKIPDEICADITIERNINFLDIFGEIANCDIHDSMLNWTFMTDFNEVENMDARTGLLVNCKDDKHAVASVVSDNHGRISVDVIYNNFTDYLKDLNGWKESQPVLNVSDETGDETSDEFDEIYITRQMAKCSTFATYIRYKKGLSFYYG